MFPFSPFLSFSQVCPCVFWKREVCVCGQCRARVEYSGSGERGRHRVRPPVLRLPAHDPRAARQAWHCQAAPTQPATRLGSDRRCVSQLSNCNLWLTSAWNWWLQKKIKIIGILSLLLVAVVVVTVTVLVLQPGKAKLASHWKTKPKWRRLGEPFCPGDCVCSGDGYKLMLSFYVCVINVVQGASLGTRIECFFF